MAESDGNRKCTIICLSSSSSSEEEEGRGSEEDEVEEIGGDDTNFSDDGDEEEEDDDDEDDGGCGCGEKEEDEESACKRVICLLQEGNDLPALRLKQLKAYLRKYGLRLSGTKAVCIQRIKEHWRIQDGNGETFYPRSSFSINCTGDVCKGDVVLFTQKVYQKFDKVTRHGKVIGKRTVAGRVVKESYGSAKQQHTFTVEVLWSKGIKKLPPLFPLLVKGRNLYRMKTFRQRWNDEAERVKVLAEKHKRGTAARLVRAMKNSKIWSADEGAKHHKHSHHTRPSSQMRMTADQKQRKHIDGHRRDTFQRHEKFSNHRQEAPPSAKQNFRRKVRSEQSWRYRKLEQLNVDVDQSYACTLQDPYSSGIELRHQNVPSHFSGYDMGSSSTMMTLPPFRAYPDTVLMPALQSQRFNHSNDTHYDYSRLNPSYSFETRNLNHFPELVNAGRQLRQFPRWRQRDRG